MKRYRRSEQPVTEFARLERIARLDNVRLIDPHEETRYDRETWQSVPTGFKSTSYGDWVEVADHSEVNPASVYALPELCSGGDYSGSLVEKSNYQAILDMMPGEYEDGREYISYSGGHGTYALAIRLDSVTDDILETLEGLEDYPIIDENLMSEMELEAQSEAWESWGRSEFKTAFGKALFDAWETSPKSEQADGETDEAYNTRLEETEDFVMSECGEISTADIDRIFYRMADLANVYWENEQGSDCSIDIDEVVKRGFSDVRLDSEWRTETYGEITRLVRDSMSDRKYDLRLVRWIDPNQLNLPFDVAS